MSQIATLHTASAKSGTLLEYIYFMLQVVAPRIMYIVCIVITFNLKKKSKLTNVYSTNDLPMFISYGSVTTVNLIH